MIKTLEWAKRILAAWKDTNYKERAIYIIYKEAIYIIQPCQTVAELYSFTTVKRIEQRDKEIEKVF